MTPDGIGHGVFTTINTASLFQCPATECNQGEVVNGIPSGHPDDVAAICDLHTISPWGGVWVFVLNHANNQVGFIDNGFLKAQFGSFSPPWCENAGISAWTNINFASLFQCPNTACNQGVVAQGFGSGAPDDLAAMCQLPSISPWGDHWALVLDRSNDEVGFLDRFFIVDHSHNHINLPAC